MIGTQPPFAINVMTAAGEKQVVWLLSLCAPGIPMSPRSKCAHRLLLSLARCPHLACDGHWGRAAAWAQGWLQERAGGGLSRTPECKLPSPLNYFTFTKAGSEEVLLMIPIFPPARAPAGCLATRPQGGNGRKLVLQTPGDNSDAAFLSTLTYAHRIGASAP